MRQIALPLDELRPGASNSLIITDANAHVFFGLGRAQTWPGRCAILVGPARSGKSLLGRFFAAQVNGEVIDDAEIVASEKLFNAWNRAQNGGAPLLMLSRIEPAKWDIALPDLRSRVASAEMLTLGPPDDELAEQLLQNHFQDRGTMIGPEAMSYVLRRMSRSYAAIEDFAREANAVALAEGSAITTALAKRILEKKN